jgi:hypothetical protein
MGESSPERISSVELLTVPCNGYHQSGSPGRHGATPAR